MPDDIDDSDDEDSGSDLIKDSGNLLKKISFKIAIFMFMIFIIISSDLFVDNVIKIFDKDTTSDHITTKGTLIQGIFLVLSYVVFDIMDQYKLV